VSLSKTYTIFTKTNEDKAGWMKAIQAAIDAEIEENPQCKGKTLLSSSVALALSREESHKYFIFN